MRSTGIDAGLLNRRILIQKRCADVQNNYGEVIASTEWADYADVWCSLKSITGAEIILGETTTQSPVLKNVVTIRWRSDISPTMYRLVYQGRVFAIDEINDVDFGHYILEITCTESQRPRHLSPPMLQTLPVYLYSTPGDSWLSGYQQIGNPDWRSHGYQRYNSVIALQARLDAGTQPDWDSWADQLVYDSADHGDFDSEVISGLDGALTTLDPTEVAKLLGMVSTVKSRHPTFKLGIFGVPWASDNQIESLENCINQLQAAGVMPFIDFGIAAFDVATYSFPVLTPQQYVKQVGDTVVTLFNLLGRGPCPITWNVYPEYIDTNQYMDRSVWQAILEGIAAVAVPSRGDILTVLAGFDNVTGYQEFVPTFHGPYFTDISNIIGGVTPVI